MSKVIELFLQFIPKFIKPPVPEPEPIIQEPVEEIPNKPQQSNELPCGPLHLIEEGLDIIKEYEGLSLKPYYCPAGIVTIGYGSTLYKDGRKVQISDPEITENQAEELLLFYTAKTETALRRLIKVEISNRQFSALVSLVYNIGISAFTSSTLLRLLNQGDTANASLEILKWNKSKGQVLPGLTRRRKAEYRLFITEE